MCVLAALVVIGSALANDDKTEIALLETNYKAAAESLRDALLNQLNDASTQFRVVHDLSQTIVLSNEIHARIAKALKKSSPVVMNVPAQLQLENVSLSPPTLRRDQDDLYFRFHSMILVRFSLLTKEGKPSSFTPIECSLPCAASPQFQWQFPTAADAIDCAKKECDRRNSGMVDINVNDAELLESLAKKR